MNLCPKCRHLSLTVTRLPGGSHKHECSRDRCLYMVIWRPADYSGLSGAQIAILAGLDPAANCVPVKAPSPNV